MKKLETHIVKEYTSWPNKIISDYMNQGKYESIWIEFPQNRFISCGELKNFEIHKGNYTSYFFEETRFKPQKLILLAIPNTYTQKPPENNIDDEDYIIQDFYESPKGIIYSANSVQEYAKGKNITIKTPFKYEVRDLLTVPQANKLLKRNPEILKEIEERFSELKKMKNFLEERLNK